MMHQTRLIKILLSTLLISGCANEVEDQSFKVQPNRIQSAKINVQLGLAYLERNDMPQAKMKFLQAKQQAPKEPEVWYGMGYFLEQTGDLKQAENHYQTAIKINPKAGAGHNNYGTFLCRHGKYLESLQQFTLAVQDENYLDPAGAYSNAGLCALKIPNKSLARHYFKLARNKDPSVKI